MTAPKMMFASGCTASWMRRAASLISKMPRFEPPWIEMSTPCAPSIEGGSNLGIFEINDAARLIQEAVHPEANIIFGAVIDDTLGDEVRVTVIAAGFDGGEPVPKALETKRTNFVAAEAGQPVAPAPAAEPRTEPAPWTPEPESIPSAPVDRTFDDDENNDLDIPDFLK